MKKSILLVLVCFVLTSLLSAQTVVPEDVYRNVDAAILENSAQNLNSVLARGVPAPWYPRLEAYVLKKARQMVIENKLEQARFLSLALIDVNLDNQEAVDLYQSIQGAMARRDVELKKTAEKEQIESFKQKAAEAKIKQDIAKTYKTATNTATGKKVYLDQDFNDHYRNNSWDFMIGLANGGFITEESGSSIKYGLSVGGSWFYHAEDFSIGADIEGRAMLLALSGDQSLDWSGSGIASAMNNSLSRNLAFRFGYAVFAYNSGSLTREEERFNTPVAGLGLRDIGFGESGRFRIALDYYPGYLFGDAIDFAMGANAGLTFVLAEMQDFDIHFHADVKDTVLLYPQGLKNDAKLILAIGAGNYD